MKNNNLSASQLVIASMVEKDSSVFDVGCGCGDLLEYLSQNKSIAGCGLELCNERTSESIGKGLSVVQGDIDTNLPFYPDNAYDYVICSKTLQATKDPKKALGELIRVGKKTIISIPNFGFWRNRLQLAIKGHMPVTKSISYQWYETPNIHFCTIDDFIDLCNDMNLQILERIAISPNGKHRKFKGKSINANLFGEEAIFMLSSK